MVYVLLQEECYGEVDGGENGKEAIRRTPQSIARRKLGRPEREIGVRHCEGRRVVVAGQSRVGPAVSGWTTLDPCGSVTTSAIGYRH